MISQQYVPVGFQQIGASTLAAATKLTVPAGADLAIIRTETANVRWRDDGTTPTSSVGMLMASTDPVFEYSGTLSAIQFIAVSGNPVLDVAFYRLAG
jgi:hypothetical protein